MIDLKVKIAGIEFKNPVITASGTFGFGREYNRFYDISVLGGICTKGLTLEPREGNAAPRIAETPSGILNSVGLQNPGINSFIQNESMFLNSIDTVVIANIAGNTIENYCAAVEKISSADCVDMIELNISCPNVKEGGIAFGVDCSSAEKVVKEAKKLAKKPLIVKLSPNVSSISQIAKTVENAGADAISLINTIGGMAIDYKTKRPILANIYGGLSGPAVKPIALKMTHEVSKAVKIPIIGMGGITKAEDILEFMIAGASAIQIGTVNFFDPNAGFRLVNELTSLLKECKIDRLKDLIGSLIIN
ncbi:MAG: dihydroorotate dehydrogenase [Firmicutes bacterium]|nr:dihydroorotate dehydrogenase [Bacillota bacterium]